MKYCDKCKTTAFDNQNYCQKCGNNKFVKSMDEFVKKEIKQQNKEQLKQSIEENKKVISEKAKETKNLISEKATPTVSKVSDIVQEGAKKASPIVKDEFNKAVNKVSDIIGEGTKEEKAKNIFTYIKDFITVRFVKFIKNYKKFKILPKQSKIKHICFPIVIVLVIAIGVNLSGGNSSAKGLSNDEATAVLTCSMISEELQSGVTYGTIDDVNLGSLSKVYTITGSDKKKSDDGKNIITVYLEYKTFEGMKTTGDLIFKYDKETKKATLTGGSAARGLQTWATYYAKN